MSTNWHEVARTYADRSGRVVMTVREQPSWVAKMAVGAAVLAMLAVIFLLIVPALVIGLIVFFAGATIAGVRRRLAGLRRPGGTLEGRKNVRVIAPRDRA